MKLHLTIRKRLTLSYAAVVLLLMAVFGIILYGAVRFQLEEAADEELRSRSDAVVRQLQEAVGKHRSDALSHSLQEQMEAVGAGEVLQLRSSDGTLLFRSGTANEVPLTQHVFRSVRLSHKTYRFYRREIALPVHYILEVGIDRSEYQEALDSVRLALYLGIPIGIVLSLLAGYWMSGRALQPIQVVTETVRDIDGRRLATRLPLRGTEDELEALSTTLNGMLDRIQDAFHRVTRFTADASHELRTPLSLVRGNLEILSTQADLSEAASTRTFDMLEEVDRMQALISDLLELARADENGAVMGELIDPADLTRRAAEIGSLLAASKGIDFTAVSPTEIFPVFGNDHALSRVLIILLDNAIRHTPSGQQVVLRVTSTLESLVIEVKDTGVGIAPKHLPYIFERFYRTDEARNRSTGGAGLGLAIAKGIVQAHRGQVNVESTLGQGTIFRVTIPAIAPIP